MEEIKIDNTENAQKTVVKPIVGTKPSLTFEKKYLILFIFPILLGVLSGYLMYRKNTDGTASLNGKNVQIVSTATEEGVKDASTFRDTATGKIEENDGKLTTEGTHVLVRAGGVSQNVYLTSSVIDLSKYIGKNVQVWGETFQGQKAGWLMDVGRIKVQ